VENVLIFASIVIGVAVTDELLSLHRLLRNRHRVSWDWLPLAVALLVLLTIVQTWWGLAQPRSGAMTIGEFLPTLGELILLFLLASASLPDAVPEAGLDLKAYYRENGSYIWSLYAAALGWLIVTDGLARVRAGAPIGRLIESQLGDAVVLALMASLIFVRRRWWHVIGLVLLATGPLGWLSRGIG
jgi:hypothetical protein